MPATDWPGDCGDVVTSLLPSMIRKVATEAVNALGYMLTGVNDIASELDWSDGDFDPSRYTATAQGTA